MGNLLNSFHDYQWVGGGGGGDITFLMNFDVAPIVELRIYADRESYSVHCSNRMAKRLVSSWEGSSLDVSNITSGQLVPSMLGISR